MSGSASGGGCVPLDLISRLGNEESLCVGLNLDVGARVNGYAALLPIITASLRGNEQQLQLGETHSGTTHIQEQKQDVSTSHSSEKMQRLNWLSCSTLC